MNLKNLYKNDDAVSPVIGVILMVAITVILAAVIGTFVLGLGKNVQSTAPTASISFDQGAGNTGEILISHDGGNSLKKSEISFAIDSTDNDGLNNPKNDVGTWAGGDNTITAGESVSVDLDGTGDGDYNSGDVVKVVWTSDGGETSSVIGEYKVE